MSEAGHIAVHEFEGSLVGVVQIELSEEVIREFQDHLLSEIRRTGSKSAIVDVSGLDVMDLHEFELLRRTFRMAGIMGCRTILAGLNPGIVAALVNLDADTDGLETALSVEHAIQSLRPPVPPEPDEAGIEDHDDERLPEEPEIEKGRGDD